MRLIVGHIADAEQRRIFQLDVEMHAFVACGFYAEGQRHFMHFVGNRIDLNIDLTSICGCSSHLIALRRIGIFDRQDP